MKNSDVNAFSSCPFGFYSLVDIVTIPAYVSVVLYSSPRTQSSCSFTKFSQVLLKYRIRSNALFV